MGVGEGLITGTRKGAVKKGVAICFWFVEGKTMVTETMVADYGGCG